MKSVVISLTFAVLAAIGVIGITHYYSVKVLSATRAYTNFESQYEKGVKDAGRHLIRYIHSGENTDYLYFETDISIPRGDKMAREALLKGRRAKIAGLGFLMGDNNKVDLVDLVWFFKKFREELYFKSAIQSWRQADVLVAQLDTLGASIHTDMQMHKQVDESDLELQINTLLDVLAIKQQDFSDAIEETARTVDHQVFVFDIVCSVAVLVLSSLLAGIMLRKSQVSQKVILRQNVQLKEMNERINRFAQSLTHDLRSPIASMAGLVSVLGREKNIDEIPAYAEMMRESLSLQDKYIREVLASIRNEKPLHDEVCDLHELVNDLERQNIFSPEGKKVQFVNELEVSALRCNVTSLKMIFNNLISNAIKYADGSKPEQWIKIRSYHKGQHCVIEVQDNGLGILPEQKEHIFKKYFKSGLRKNSLGLGLYFVRKAIEEMQGTISVKSSPSIGTSFIVSLPL